MITNSLKRIKLALLMLTLAACTPMEEGESGQSNVDNEPATNQFNLQNVKAQGFSKNKQRAKVVGQITTDVEIIFPSGADLVTGNLSFLLNVSDSVPLTSIDIVFPSSGLGYSICETNCGNEFKSSVIGLNPTLAEVLPGQIEMQVWASNTDSESTLAFQSVINWQPHEITGVAAIRTDQDVTISWLPNSSIKRYNVYVAARAGLNRLNQSSLDNAEHFLALTETTITVPVMDPNEPLQILVTGVEGSGESGFSDVLSVAGLDGTQPLSPIAVNDNFTLAEDNELVGNVLDNDSDPAAGQLRASLETEGETSNGFVQLDEDGHFVYTPNANYFGQDSFNYTIINDQNLIAFASVTLEITSVNDIPVVINDEFNIPVQGPLTIEAPGILSNDSDIDGDVLSVDVARSGTLAEGDLQLNSDGSFTFSPNVSISGTISFSYLVTDGNGGEAEGEVVLIANAENLSPQAVNDVYQINEDETLLVTDPELGLLGNDSDPNLDTLTILDGSLTDPEHGTLTVAVDGTFQYIPDPNFNGIDTFFYEVVDSGGLTASASVQIDVISVPDMPVALNDQYGLVDDTFMYVDASLGLLTNDINLDEEVLQVDLDSIIQPSLGTVSVFADGGFSYSTEAGFNGSVSFSYQAVNSAGLSNRATVVIAVSMSNRAPIVIGEEYNVEEDTTLIIGADDVNNLLANDSDLDGDELFITVNDDTFVNNGILTLNEDGSFQYVPNADFFGTDSFNYEVYDGNGGFTTATATIIVSPVNDFPVVNGESFSIDEDSVLNAQSTGFTNLLANDSDIDGDTLSISTTPAQMPNNGSLTLNSNGSFEYSPTLNFSGSDSFQYTVLDGNGGSQNGTVSVSINAQNDDPSVTGEGFTIDEDTVFNSQNEGFGNLLSNDLDVDGDALMVNPTPVQMPLNGTLTLSSDGAFEYVPTANFNGSDSFQYQVEDGNGGVTNGTVTFTIVAINDAPIVNGENFTIDEDMDLNSLSLGFVNLLLNDTDIDGDALTLNTSPVQSPNSGTVTINIDGTFEYTPEADFNGSDSFQYQVDDGNGGIDTAVVNITVNPVNDRPDAVDDAYIVDEDDILDVLASDADNLLSNDTDLDVATNGDVISVVVTPVSGPSNGTLGLNDNGSFTYTPDTDFNGSDSFRYLVQDLAGLTSEGTVSIAVNMVNDSPIASDESFDVDENALLGDVVGSISASDIENDNLSFAIIGGADASLFNINSTSGEITVAVSSAFDFETNTQHQFNVEITDDGLPVNASTEITITIDINDIQGPLFPVLNQEFGTENFGTLDYETFSTRAAFKDVTEYEGTIYFAGYVEGFDKDILVKAYTDSGFVNTSFASNGTLIMDLGAHETVHGIIEFNNFIYLAVQQDFSSHSEVCVVKVDTSGVLDSLSGDNNSGVRCTSDGLFHKPLAIEARNSNVFVVGSTLDEINSDLDTLFIKLAESDLSLLDNTPFVADVSGGSRNDYATDIKWFDGTDFMTVGVSTSINGDLDGYIRYIDEFGQNTIGFNGGNPLVQDWSGIGEDDEFRSLDGIESTSFIAYVGGITTMSNGYTDGLIIAIDKTSTLDTSFGIDGIKVYDFDLDAGVGDKSTEITEVKYDNVTNNLFVTGAIRDGSLTDTPSVFVAQLTPSLGGVLNTNYATSGIALFDTALSGVVSNSIFVDVNGNSWLAAYKQTTIPYEDNAVAVLISASGQLSDCFPNDGGCVSDGFDNYDLPEPYYSDEILKSIHLQNGPYAGSFLSLGIAQEDNIIQETMLTAIDNTGGLDDTFDKEFSGEEPKMLLGDGNRPVKIGGSFEPETMIETADGGVIIIGNTLIVDSWVGLMFKFTSEAAFDASFASNGSFFWFGNDAPNNSTFKDVMIDSNGKIVVVGEATGVSGNQAVMLRFLPDGTLDPSFGIAGRVDIDVTKTVEAVQEDSAGNYLIASYSGPYPLVVDVQKVSENGTPDAGYAGTGAYEYNFGNDIFLENLQLLVDDNDNTVVIVSYDDSYYGGAYSSLFIKLDSSGILDSSFDTDGLADMIFSDSDQSVINDAAFDSQGNIVAVGWGLTSGVRRGTIARITPSGIPDPMFNTVGYSNEVTCGDSDEYNSLILLNDNEIVVSGTCEMDSNVSEFDASIFKFSFEEIQQ